MSAVLTLKSVSKIFDETRAVDNVTLEIEPGQFVGVIGRSGAGKSTMLRLVNRLIDPTQGSISFGGTDPCMGSIRRLTRRRGRFHLVEPKSPR